MGIKRIELGGFLDRVECLSLLDFSKARSDKTLTR